MRRSHTVVGTFLVTLSCVASLYGLVWVLLGPGEKAVMLGGTNGGEAIAPGVSGSLWAIIASFLLATSLGVALVIAGRTSPARAMGSLLIGFSTALALTYAMEVQALPWNSYAVTWSDLLDFWGLFFAGFAGLFAFSVALALSGREFSRVESGNKVGTLIGAIVAGLFGLLVGLWNISWHVEVWSMTEVWLWLLSLVPLVTSAWLFRSYIQGRKITRVDESGSVARES